MNLGNKIADLRKKNNLSQEELAEKIGVTRQTISKWELDETTPDIKQAKELSKIFNVSLDELANNDINNILIEKVSNTERLSEITIKILKAMGVFLIVMFVIGGIGFVLLNFNPAKAKDREITGKYTLTCTIDNEEYLYEFEYNRNHQIISAGGDAYIADHADADAYDYADKAKAHVEDWFKDHNGLCVTKEN